MDGSQTGSRFDDVSWHERSLRLLALVLVGAALAGACNGDEPADTAPDVPVPGAAIGTDELFGAIATAVGDELWIIGGFRAPEGTSPPSSLIGPQWQPSNSIQVYDPDGDLVRRLELPDRGGTVEATVVGHGGDRYVVGHRCPDPGYCAGPATPVLFRVDGDAIEEVHLDVPPADFGDAVDAGRIIAVGHREGVVWVTQDLGAGVDIFGGARLLAIDLDDGTITEVELPDGVRGAGSFCVATAGVVVATAALDEQAVLEELTIMRHPGNTSTGDWEEVASIPVDLGYVGAGAIDCDDGSGDVVVSLHSSPPTVAAVDGTTGAVTTPFTTLAESGVEYLGRIGAAELLLSSTTSGTRTLWRRGADGTVSRVDGIEIEPGAQPRVLDDRLVDARTATMSVDDRVELPTIATDR